MNQEFAFLREPNARARRTRIMMFRHWACSLTLVATIADAAPATKGLFLVGGSVKENDPPVLALGSDDPSTATAATLGNLGLEVISSGEIVMAVNDDVTSLPGMNSTNVINAESLSVGGVSQWALWDFDSFDTPATGMWSTNDRSVCGTPNDLFLGGHCHFGSTTTTRTYENLPPHRQVRIRARVHFFDDWNGESVAIQVDGRTVWARAHSWCPGFLKWMCLKYGVDSCGRDTPDQLSSKAEATVAHTGSTMKLSFGSNLAVGSDACRASWGVDDVSIEVA